jgi:hypothetical protein
MAVVLPMPFDAPDTKTDFPVRLRFLGEIEG